MTPDKLPPCPIHLSAASRALWRSIVGRFALDPEHLAVLASTLEARDRATEARERLAVDGCYIDGARGGLIAHPAVAVERDSRVAFLRGMRQLGLDSFADDQRQGRDLKGRFG